MSTPEFRSLLETGYSEAFLRTPQGSHGKLRQHYLNGELKPMKCQHCGDLYALAREICQPVLNAAGGDLRHKFKGSAQDRGYCSSKCEYGARTPQTEDLFGTEE
jgi:hypothetical protein